MCHFTRHPQIHYLSIYIIHRLCKESLQTLVNFSYQIHKKYIEVFLSTTKLRNKPQEPGLLDSGGSGYDPPSCHISFIEICS